MQSSGAKSSTIFNSCTCTSIIYLHPCLESVCAWQTVIQINNKTCSSVSARISSAFRSLKTSSQMDYYSWVASNKSRKSQQCLSQDYPRRDMGCPIHVCARWFNSVHHFTSSFGYTVFLRSLSLWIAKSSFLSAWSKLSVNQWKSFYWVFA